MTQRWWIVVVAIVGLAGCREGAPHSLVTRSDSAGVEIVVSPPTASPALTIEATPLTRIGQEASGPYQFAMLGAGGLLADGAIAVAELRSREVRVFDATGRHQRTLGRPGQGPGEFSNIARLFVFPNDSVAVYDQVQRRLTVFPRDGSPPRLAVNPMTGNALMFGRLSSGVALFFDPGRGFRPDLAPGLQWAVTAVHAVDPAGHSASVIAQMPSREQFVVPGGDTRPRLPAHYAVQATTSDGFYWATSDRFEVRYFEASGQLRRILRREVEPTRVTPAMLATHVEHRLAEVRRFEGEGAVARYRHMYEGASRGDVVPVFHRAMVDDQDRLWLARDPWPDQAALAESWHLFDRDGAWQGELAAPPGMQVVAVRGDRVLGYWRDSLDVAYVQVHRLRTR